MGIAQVAAQAGYEVHLADRDRATVEKSRDKLALQVKKLVEKWKKDKVI